MEMNPGTILVTESCAGFCLSIYPIEKTSTGFIFHLVGALDVNSYLVLEKKVERILTLIPEVIIFDMEHVHYINCRGLQVILRTIKQMKKLDGCVYLMNVQVQIIEMFEIMNGLLPKWIFTDPQEMENYLCEQAKMTPDNDL